MFYAYLAVMNYAISLLLVRNEDGVQKPVYYISKSLQETETRYLPLEKAVLAIVHATRKLPHYFQAHTNGGVHPSPFASSSKEIRLYR